MNIEICGVLYTLKAEKESQNILHTLFKIKHTQNRALAFKHGCKSGICGSCAIKVNGVEKLACKTIIKENDVITPLSNLKVIKDLVVDTENIDNSIKHTKAFLQVNSQKVISSDQQKKVDLDSNCILCNSCVSACPVYSINENFLAPFAMVRNYRYINDMKENDITSKLESVQVNGIWDCTLCGNCNMVCPSHIDIKGDIQMLRNKSAQFGYNNTNLNISFDTNLDFGFNPNSF